MVVHQWRTNCDTVGYTIMNTKDRRKVDQPLRRSWSGGRGARHRRRRTQSESSDSAPATKRPSSPDRGGRETNYRLSTAYTNRYTLAIRSAKVIIAMGENGEKPAPSHGEPYSWTNHNQSTYSRSRKLPPPNLIDVRERVVTSRRSSTSTTVTLIRMRWNICSTRRRFPRPRKQPID